MSGLAPSRILYGVHSMTPLRSGSNIPYGTLKVLGASSLALTQDQEILYAGSNKAAIAAEAKTLACEVSLKAKAYPDFLFEIFLGASITKATGDAAGTVSAITNVQGVSLMNASTGIASIAVKSASKTDLKFGRYLLKVLTATTVGIYLTSDVDASRGTAVVYTDDTLLLVAAIPTITMGGSIDIPNLGLTLTGGSGTIAMVAGDTAEFSVLPPSSTSSIIRVGQSGAINANFVCDFVTQKRATGEMFDVRAFKCVGSGLPIGMEEQSFSAPEAKVTCLYDSGKDAVLEIRAINPS